MRLSTTLLLFSVCLLSSNGRHGRAAGGPTYCSYAYANVTHGDRDRKWAALRLGDPVASERGYGAKTPPIGGHGGGRETLFGTYGDPIVSIFGRQRHDLDAIGFVQLDEQSVTA